MILDQIILNNVGVFRGEQCVNLRPPSKDKPVVLVGGLNGAGKTTLLESLQLVLFGKLASAGRMGGLGYEEYLRRLINRQTPGRDGALIEIAFRVHEEGKYRHYRVRRSWADSGKRVRESIEVFVDGEFDQVVSDTWQERVGRFIPHQMAHLFFFDGDRIEALADPARSADLLRSAIDALLGVDLVDQLQTDLKALWRRKAKEQMKGPGRAELEAADREAEELQARHEQLAAERASCQTELDRTLLQLEAVEKSFREQGGELSERQSGLEQQQMVLLAERDSLARQMLDLTAQDLPLAMNMPLLQQAMNKAQEEQAQIRSIQVGEAVEDRLSDVLRRLAEKGLPKQHLKLVEAEFRADLDRDQRDSVVRPVFELSPIGQAKLQTLLGYELAEQQAAATTLVDRYRSVEHELEQLDRMLAAVPDSDSLASLLQERGRLQQKVDDSSLRLEVVDGKISEVKQQIERQAQRLDRLYADDRATRVANSDLDRIRDHSIKVTRAIERFRERVTKKHTLRLEQLILQSFQFLLRKRGLIHGISIDPVTCAVTLRNADQEVVSPERLSMGERQLLAVAMLWGMAQASGRPLPVVVDTPLGRLDSDHRTNLVERYFPRASHQVILLSTDEEIDARYYGRMKDSIGHMYRIEYNDETHSSVVAPGYFFEKALA